MVEREGHDLELTEADLSFVVDEVEAGGLDPERLKQLVRSDPSFRDAVLSDGRVFAKTAAADEELLRVSPALYFQVLLRRAQKDLGQASHTLERSGGETVVVFDTDNVSEFLAKPTVTDYMAAMLASFTRVESYVMPVRVRRGTWRRVRFNDMDVDSLARLAASVDEPQRFRYFKRIADVCLLILGIFPSSAASAGQHGLRTGRRGRRTAEEYADIGRRHYGTAMEHPAAQAAGLAEPMELLRDNFAVARKSLNFVTEQYLRYSRTQVFDVGIP